MKIFSAIIILTFFSVVNFQSEKARGNYKFEVGKMSRYYNAKMQFKDSLFILTFSNGIKSIGKINYYRTQTSLDTYLKKAFATRQLYNTTSFKTFSNSILYFGIPFIFIICISNA